MSFLQSIWVSSFRTSSHQESTTIFGDLITAASAGVNTLKALLDLIAEKTFKDGLRHMATYF